MYQTTIYSELLDNSNISFAVDLALHARKQLDPYYDPIELESITQTEIIEEISRILYSQK